MKTRFTIYILLLITSISLLSFTGLYKQDPSTKLTINDVYSTNTIVYYGLDFSNFRLVEPDRINEGAEIRDVQFPAWNGFVMNTITMDKMAKWFKKTSVVYYAVPVTIANNKVADANVVVRLPYKSDMATIQKTISEYQKPSNTNNKIGMVVSVEYFQKNTREASAYIIFFEISTGAIISSEKMTNKVANGNGLTAFWGQSCQFFIKDYYDMIYSKGL
ncbi:MAG TPA: hypothetical protein VJI69_00025 [Bacteroidia bacterium]|nr:hypothetical protein [Bacteroidia bacterium]